MQSEKSIIYYAFLTGVRVYDLLVKILEQNPESIFGLHNFGKFLWIKFGRTAEKKIT